MRRLFSNAQNMKMGKLFAVVGAVLALASVANACNGDLVIENSQDQYFDGAPPSRRPWNKQITHPPYPARPVEAPAVCCSL